MRSSNAMSHRSMPKFRLHPLIHTLLGFAQAQDVEKKNSEGKTSHLLDLTQDIVAWSQEEKCRVCNAHSRGVVRLQIITLYQWHEKSEAEPFSALPRICASLKVAVSRQLIMAYTADQASLPCFLSPAL